MRCFFFFVFLVFVGTVLAEEWANTALTTGIWSSISKNEINTLASFLQQAPNAANARAEDGRGGLWWAYEFANPQAAALLLELGAINDLEDTHGAKPRDLYQGDSLEAFEEQISQMRVMVRQQLEESAKLQKEYAEKAAQKKRADLEDSFNEDVEAEPWSPPGGDSFRKEEEEEEEVLPF